MNLTKFRHARQGKTATDMNTAFNSIKLGLQQAIEHAERRAMNMHNPAHPGELLTGWLDDLGVSVAAFAAHVGISRVMLSRLLHGHAAVSADMDLRLSEALGTTPGHWLALQSQRDLWTARQTAKERKRIKRMAVPELEAA